MCPLGSLSQVYDLIGLLSVRISLNFIVMYTWNTDGILPIWDLEKLTVAIWNFSKCQNLECFSYAVQSLLTRFAAANKND